MNFDTTGLLQPQFKHAEFLVNSLEQNGIAWDGSATGTGKTYAACAILRHLKCKFVVICPKLGIPTWKLVLESFGLKPEFIINYEKLARGNTSFYKRISQKKYKKLYNIGKDIEVPEFLRAMFNIPKD